MDRDSSDWGFSEFSKNVDVAEFCLRMLKANFLIAIHKREKSTGKKKQRGRKIFPDYLK